MSFNIILSQRFFFFFLQTEDIEVFFLNVSGALD